MSISPKGWIHMHIPLNINLFRHPRYHHLVCRRHVGNPYVSADVVLSNWWRIRHLHSYNRYYSSSVSVNIYKHNTTSAHVASFYFISKCLGKPLVDLLQRAIKPFHNVPSGQYCHGIYVYLIHKPEIARMVSWCVMNIYWGIFCIFYII